MKILVLADIHANWTALAAIRETFDACLFVGDLVDYGTDPLPCIDWVRKHSTAAVRGNHDHAVAQRVPVRGGNGLRTLTAATRPIHWDLLSSGQTRYLARLPVTKHLTVGEQRFFLVHGTPRDPLDEYLAADPEAWAARLGDVDADFVCVGHTHVPFHLELDRLQVLNPGSVGQPRDGDPRCSYAIIEDGNVEIRRVEYDIDAAVDQMKQAGLDGPALELAESMLRTGGSLPDATNGAS
jgi:putative phosphoesterase